MLALAMNLRETWPTGAMSVGALTATIKTVLEESFQTVLVVGEISNYKLHSSGHRYFTLKDADAQISCVMWRSRTLEFEPADGMRVVVGARVTVYMARGNYQLDCAYMRPDGIGELYKAFERLKSELQQRGWFDPSRKRMLPRFPQRVGIATSKTGAVLHDMLTTIDRRYRPLEVVFRPTIVQGETAAQDIAAAIAELNTTGVDVVIVGRGGGSIEDLWCFNTEGVARAIFESTVPVIAAIGHETDVTIADFVADRRAPTPTAAAELVTPYTSNELLQRIDEMQQHITQVMLDRTASLEELVMSFVTGSALDRIQDRLEVFADRVNELAMRQLASVHRRLDILTATVHHAMQRLEALHPYRPLRLGFAIIERNQSPLPATEHLLSGEIVRIVRWQDQAEATIHSVERVIKEATNGKEDEQR